jgi:hypothetical protein
MWPVEACPQVLRVDEWEGRGCRDGADRAWHAGGGRVQLGENMTVTVTVTIVR